MVHSYKIEKSTITMTTYKYMVDFLRRVGSCAKSKVNYPLFGLETTTRAWIISLGIGSRPNKYQRTRAGKKIFYKIHTLVHQGQLDAHGEWHLVVLANIWPIQKDNNGSIQKAV